MQKGRGSLAPCWFGVSPKVTFSRPHCKKRSNPARHSEWEGLLRLMKGSFLCVFSCSVSNSSNHDLEVYRKPEEEFFAKQQFVIGKVENTDFYSAQRKVVGMIIFFLFALLQHYLQ